MLDAWLNKGKTFEMVCLRDRCFLQKREASFGRDLCNYKIGASHSTEATMSDNEGNRDEVMGEGGPYAVLNDEDIINRLARM